MTHPPLDAAPIPLARSQQDRLRKFGASQCVDIHCHILPGIDDGPATMSDAIALCRGLVADGITTAIATPHQLGRYDGSNSKARVCKAVAELRDTLRQEQVPLAVEPGADVRLDERIPDLIDANQVLTLGDTGRFVLLEFSHDTYMDPSGLLTELIARGRMPIISHPERHHFIQRRPDMVLPWLQQGASLQITAASIVGAFGPQPEQTAWHYLKKGLVQLVATDAHNLTSRKPFMTAAADRIASTLSHVNARRICFENPLHVLKGEDLFPVRSLRSVNV